MVVAKGEGSKVMESPLRGSALPRLEDEFELSPIKGNLTLFQGVKFLYIPIFSYIFGHFLFSPIFQRNSYFFLYFRGFIVVRAITFHEIMHILPVLVETFFDLQCYLYLYEYNLHVLD